jgi:hypothetical protein
LQQRVLGRRAWDAKLERDLATGVGNVQLDHRVASEDRLGGREVELRQVEIGPPGVQAHKEVVAGGAHPAARFGYEGIIGCGHAPGGVLFRGQSAPATGDSANVVAVALLLGGAGITTGCEGHKCEPSQHGPLLYFNCQGRLDEAVAAVEPNAGKVLQPKHPIGPYGFRAVVLDSEGNRIALHSM